MKVVLDCNVVVAAARVDGACRKVIDRVVRHHEIILSAAILSEYETVAGRPDQAPHRHTLRLVIGEIERLAVTVEPVDVVFGVRDPDDEVYLATAAAGGTILITGNTRDFTEPRYGPVEIWSPRAFLDRMA
ncbi:MAG: PIN domain-containing protein [bacterium]|nr:PIN domain-containing protein [bacterium]